MASYLCFVHKVVLKGVGKAKVTVFNDSIAESLIDVHDKEIIRFN